MKPTQQTNSPKLSQSMMRITCWGEGKEICMSFTSPPTVVKSFPVPYRAPVGCGDSTHVVGPDESGGWWGAEKCTPKPWVLNQSCFSFGKGRSGEKGIFSECCEWASRILKNYISCQINIDNCCQTIRNLFSIGNRVDVPLFFVHFLILFVLQHVYSIDTWYHGILIYYIVHICSYSFSALFNDALSHVIATGLCFWICLCTKSQTLLLIQ